MEFAGMAQVMTSSVVRQIETLFAGGSVTGLSDRQLIERFIGRRDPAGEAAFAALVARHGPMVLGVCRQLLGDRHHAEDAFQATFFVLARKARSIHDPDLLGNWLYGVALRTARKARCRLARRRQSEEGGAWGRSEIDPGAAADEPIVAREQAEALHNEIGRLPVSFRLPVVLCYFEGLTVEEAARQLQWPHGTVRSRLARARDKLRIGLTRSGVALPAAGLSPRSASASVSSSLCDITTKAAMNFAAGQATATLAASLAQEVLRAMLVNKLRLIATTLLLLVAVATGAGYLSRSLASQDEPKRQPDAPRPQVAARPDDTTQRPAPGRMFVVGRVLDPQGKPVSDAMTMVYAAIKNPGSGRLRGNVIPTAVGQARSDGSGRFQIDASRTSSSRHHQVGAVAVAPGYGAGWAELDPDAGKPVVDITLRPEHVIQGRLFDVIGRPVPGVEVMVQNMGRVIPANQASHRQESIEGPWYWWNTRPSYYWWNTRNELPAWPKPAISDAEGRFTIRGAGRNLRVILFIDDPRFARQSVPIDTDSTSESKSVTLALEPAKVFRGRITDASTGKPIPHAQLVVMAYNGNPGTHNEFEADADGRFRVNPPPADRYEVSAAAPDGQPYLTVAKLVNWPKAAVEYPIDLALPRGVLIRGKVTEEGSGKPVAGASITSGALQTAEGPSLTRNGRAASGPDGSFQISVVPSPGCLVVLGPSDDYVIGAIGRSMMMQGKPGGSRFYAHAFLACDPKPTDATLDVNIVLRPSTIVHGRVVGPDGQPVQDAWMISRVLVPPSPVPWLSWTPRHHGDVKSGRFAIHGLDPDAEVPVYFLDPHHKLGATANLSGKSAANRPVTVQLQPCGTAKARLVDTSGTPLAGRRGSGLIAMVVTPGPYPVPPRANETRLLADVATLSGIDSVNYADGPMSDASGKIAFPALVPGATYRRNPYGTKGTPLSDEFTVQPGETLDLGDIVIEKRQQ
jgi:RNA polymerase sigma factor (sigma-70 family)